MLLTRHVLLTTPQRLMDIMLEIQNIREMAIVKMVCRFILQQEQQMPETRSLALETALHIKQTTTRFRIMQTLAEIMQAAEIQKLCITAYLEMLIPAHAPLQRAHQLHPPDSFVGLRHAKIAIQFVPHAEQLGFSQRLPVLALRLVATKMRAERAFQQVARIATTHVWKTNQTTSIATSLKLTGLQLAREQITTHLLRYMTVLAPPSHGAPSRS
jgi:hypothetical protein